MLGFVETLDSRGAVRIDDIERIGSEVPNAHDVMLRKVHMRDGRSFDTFSHENGGLLTRPTQIIPALPGTSIISVWLEDPASVIMRTSVIAWALCLDGEVRPVTPGGVWTGIHRTTHVELPDGSIEGVSDWAEPAAFKDAADMVAHFEAERARHAPLAPTVEEGPAHG
jgi:hypothetical protein